MPIRKSKSSPRNKKTGARSSRSVKPKLSKGDIKDRAVVIPFIGRTPWWHAGVRFACQGSGRCCTSRGEYGFVYLTLDDRRQMAKFLGLSTSHFTRRYCVKKSGIYHLRDESAEARDCRFLKNHSCSIYPARPMQCRTWPFWPENMGAKAWQKNLVEFCPGVGKGRTYSREEIQKILDQQNRSTQSLCGPGQSR